MTYEDLEQLLRLMAWERIKGEINGMLQTWSGGQTAPDWGQYERIAAACKRFIGEVDTEIA